MFQLAFGHAYEYALTQYQPIADILLAAGILVTTACATPAGALLQ
jgi:hypothetical protein